MRLLHHDVERWARIAPDSVAICEGDEPEGGQEVTYGELDAWSDRIALLLTEIGVTAGDRVAIGMPKGAAAIATMLAASKIGAPYVPIDPDSPAARISLVLAAAEPAVVIADPTAGATVQAALDADPDTTVGTIGDAEATWPTEPAFTGADLARFVGVARPSFDVYPSDLAHILFTSGSTGIPKGVMITHANVVAFIDWAVEHFGYTSTDQISGHSPLHFDLSTFDIYGTFAAGATLHPVPKRVNVNPSALVAWIRGRALTQWFSVPSALNHMVRFDDVVEGDFPTLKRLVWCGEVLPTPTLITLMTALPHAEFTNLYGPTEATIASSWYRVDACPTDPSVQVPIGRPCAGEDLVVIDEEDQIAADDAIAHLYIEGVGLSPGYWRDEEKTRAVFRTDLIAGRRLYFTGDLAWRGGDGNVHFVGRVDSQVKSRGHRIELGEIEAALQSIEVLADSAVVAIDAADTDGAAICAAYQANATTRPAELAKALSAIVPKYMLPHRWMELDSLPKNVNGKIDRPVLRTLFSEREAPAASSDARLEESQP